MLPQTHVGLAINKIRVTIPPLQISVIKTRFILKQSNLSVTNAIVEYHHDLGLHIDDLYVSSFPKDQISLFSPESLIK